MSKPKIATTSLAGLFVNAAACCPATQPAPWISTPSFFSEGSLMILLGSYVSILPDITTLSVIEPLLAFESDHFGR